MVLTMFKLNLKLKLGPNFGFKPKLIQTIQLTPNLCSAFG